MIFAKRNVIIFMSLFTLSQCMQFKDSDLDPNSPFSQLLRLIALQNANQLEYRTTIEMRITDSNDVPYSESTLAFGRATSGSNGNQRLVAGTRILDSSGTIMNGEIELVLFGLGIFEFQVLDILENPPLAGFQLDIFAGLSNENLEQLVPINLFGDLKVTVLSVRQELVRRNNRYLSDFKGMGEREGRIFGLSLVNTFSPNFTDVQISLIVSEDGLNFRVLPLLVPEFNYQFSGNPSSLIQIEASNMIRVGENDFFFLAQKIDSSTRFTYAVRTNGFSITEIYPVSRRSTNPDVTYIDVRSIRFLAGKIFYAEYDTFLNRVEFREDANFLKPGSTNNPTTMANLIDAEFSSPRFVQEFQNGIIYPSDEGLQPTVAYATNDLDNVFSFTTDTSRPNLPESNGAMFAAGRSGIYYIQSNPSQQMNVGKINTSSDIFNDTFINIGFSYNSNVSNNNFLVATNPLVEFGTKRAIMSGLGSASSLLVGDDSTQNWVTVEFGTILNSTDPLNFADPLGLIPLGNKLHYYNPKSYIGAPPDLLMTETENGTSWTEPRRINF